MYTGARKLISSMVAVTTRRRACFTAAMPAAVSTSRMIVPPCTYPELFACSISIATESSVSDSDGRRAA